MSRKQKKTLARIILSAVLFFTFLILERTGVLAPLPRWAVALLFAVPYLIIGWDVLWGAVRNILHGEVFDEKFLMTIATFAAFGIGEYSEGCAVMLFYQIGEFCQGLAVGRSRRSIADLMSIAPEYANLVLPDGSVEETDPEEVAPGSVIVIRPGEKIPLDGIVLEGESYLNTAALTGESVPRRAAPGDAVISGCVNADGLLKVQTTKAYEDSTVARILDLVENASNKKSRTEQFITRFARVYTPIVTVAALLLAVLPPLLFRQPFGEWIRRACIFLIVSCPCALVISVPLGFFGGIGAASRQGILVKGSNYLEAVADLRTLVFDKTGTLTRGEFRVTSLHPAGSATQEELLETAAIGEGFSTHPIARSVLEAYGRQPDLSRVTSVTDISGQGLRAVLDGRELLLGNDLLMRDNLIPFTPAGGAGTVVHAALDGVYLGSILISDTVRETAAGALGEMKANGIRRTVMLTGDREETAALVAKELSLDEYHAALLPADKVDRMEAMLNDPEREGKLGFVGDGINDAPVLMRADVGIAMGAIGSDAAIEAADIVLMDDRIEKLPSLLRIGKKTMRIVRENVVFALTVKLAILLLGALGLTNLWLAVFADVGVALLAILNSMRTLRVR